MEVDRIMSEAFLANRVSKSGRSESSRDHATSTGLALRKERQRRRRRRTEVPPASPKALLRALNQYKAAHPALPLTEGPIQRV